MDAASRRHQLLRPRQRGPQLDAVQGQLVRRLGERPLGMDDPAARRHPLRPARTHDAGVPGAIAVLVAARQEIGDSFDAGVGMRADAVLARLHPHRAEVVEEDPRPDGMALAIRQRAAHGERAHRGHLRVDHAFDRARRDGALLEPRAHRRSAL
jgi:hypothetical protein